MKKETDELTELFRHRLTDMEMPVNNGLWDTLNRDIAAAQLRKRLLLRRIASSAAVLLLLLATSATIWVLSPNEEIGQAFAPFAAVDGDFFTNSEMAAPVMQALAQETDGQGTPASIKQNLGLPLFGDDATEGDEYADVQISVTFSLRETTYFSNRYSSRFNKYSFWRAVLNSDLPYAQPDDDSSNLLATESAEQSSNRTSKWAMKVGAGISLPDNAFDGVPFTVGATVERRFNRYLGLETGLSYSRVPAVDKALHYLAVPIKANGYLYTNKHVQLYASAGGAIGKCVAGAPDNSFRKEPVQLSVQAGVGANVRLSDKVDIFVEPSVSHHFSTNSQLASVRTSRPTNFNLLCGLRINY